MVVGDPVGALDEDRAPVDGDRERGAVLVVVGPQLDGAEAHPGRPAVERRAVPLVVEGEPDGGERLVAVPGGPPQRRPGHPDDDAAGGGVHRHPDPARAPAGLGAQHEGACRRQAAALDVDEELDDAGAVVLDPHDGAHPGQPGDPPAVHGHGLPEPRGAQVRPPVPAERARHLADVVERGGVGVRPLPQPVPLGERVGRRGGDVDRELPPGAVRERPDVEPVRPVHVERPAEQRAAERHRGDGVDAGEDEVDPLVVRGRVQSQRTGEPPVDVVHPRQVPLVGCEQSRMYQAPAVQNASSVSESHQATPSFAEFNHVKFNKLCGRNQR